MFFFGVRIFKIPNFRCENGQDFNFGISDGKSLTRPYVFDVFFSHLAFFDFLLKKLHFFGVFNLEK